MMLMQLSLLVSMFIKTMLLLLQMTVVCINGDLMDSVDVVSEIETRTCLFNNSGSQRRSNISMSILLNRFLLVMHTLLS